MSFEEYLKNNYNLNEPIFIESIKYKEYSRSWIFSQIKKLVDSGVLKRYDNGVYYFPKKMAFGYTSLDPGKVVKLKYLSNGNSVYGYIAGLSLLNSAGLSAQCPNMLELVSNRESSRVRDVQIGFQKVRARKARTVIDSKNVNTLQLLDLMNTINPDNMDETQRFMLSKYIKSSGVTNSMVKQYAKFYPLRTMKNFVESGAVYELT